MGADGSDVVTLAGENFLHPDLIRFVESRDRRWAAWADGGALRVAASAALSSAKTVAISSKLLSVLAVSDDGDTIAYEIHTTNDPMTSAVVLYVVHVHDRSIKRLRTFAGPFITCLAGAAFDATAKRLIAVGCGSGKAAGLVLINTSNGSIISEDDKFSAWPGGWAFGADLKTVWLIADMGVESDVVRYDTATRARAVLYRSPVWKQSDGSDAPNLPGPLLSAPDESGLAFSRYPPDGLPEVHVLAPGGGPETMIFKSDSFDSVESWSPNGDSIAISVGGSGSTQRMVLVDPRTRVAAPIETPVGYVEFLAWIVV
jgi:Tol biopolymer transport system component